MVVRWRVYNETSIFHPTFCIKQYIIAWLAILSILKPVWCWCDPAIDIFADFHAVKLQQGVRHRILIIKIKNATRTRELF
jgi:hypothetical protein